MTLFNARLFWLAALFNLLLPATYSFVAAQISSKQFEDYSVRLGISGDNFSWGSSWADGNGDGYPDFFVSNHYQERSGNQPYLYLSNPGERFTLTAVPDYMNTLDMHGAGWFDFDNDGDQDLMITTGRVSRNSLLVNDGTGQFTERAVELGADFPFCRGRTPLYWDQNRDGLLDILTTAGAILLPTQLPTTLAMQNPFCDPTCFSLVGPDSSGWLPGLSSTQGLLIDPDGDDQLNPMIVTQSSQPWGAVGCLPFEIIGATTVPFTNEVLAGDLNGDMKQDLFFVRNRLDQSYVENPVRLSFLSFSDLDRIDPSTVSVLIQPFHGTTAILPGGILNYASMPGFIGRDSLIVRYCDSLGTCQPAFFRFVIGDSVFPDSGFVIPPQTFVLSMDSSFSISIPDLIQPYKHRLRCNLFTSAGFDYFSFKTRSDSILIAFAEVPESLNEIFIGASGYHPAPAATILLRASDSINHGTKSSGPGSTQRVIIGYDTLEQSWTIGVAALSDFGTSLSVFSPGPMDIIRTVNFDSLPEVLPNALLVHENNLFTNVTLSSGLDQPGEFYSGTLGDFDNDMDLDIYESNGILGRNVPNTLWENDGQGVFHPARNAGGAAGTSRGAAGTVSMADYDRDGFLDLLVDNGRDLEKQGPYELFHNNGNQNRWLGLKLRGTQSNRDGIGAVVRVYAGGKGQIRYADGGIHRYVQNDPTIHFGLGVNKKADSVTVRWPSGARTVLTNVLANQYLEVVEPLSGGWACFPPGNTSQQIDFQAGFELSWSPVDCAQGYEVSIRIQGDSVWSLIGAINTSVVIPLNFLTKNSTYEWTVHAICESGNKGGYSRLNHFSTQLDCQSPQNLQTIVTSFDSITLGWDPVPLAEAYMLFWLTDTATTYDSILVVFNRVFLPPGTVDSMSFSWYVKTICPFSERSEPSATAYYFPESVRSSGPSTCRLQPNPAQTSVQLQGLRARTSFRISDLSGREWSRGETEPGQTISLVGLPAGAYLLSWQSDDGGNWQSLPLQVR